MLISTDSFNQEARRYIASLPDPKDASQLGEEEWRALDLARQMALKAAQQLAELLTPEATIIEARE